MAIVCILTGMIELLTLVTITGVLITLLALFNLLELLIRAVNPVCVYLLRHTGNLFSCSIQLTIRKMHQVYLKMCPDETIESTIVGTIEPLPSDAEFNLPGSLNLDENNNVDSNTNSEIPNIITNNNLNETPENVNPEEIQID
ncbi:uncharacterized protein LOC122506932 [Leptopilina heterotoma]|uniref:uncharacterized protein LOC122506932 n=1 Tax=Leptopilina heterotoma TaxID=63436 RepID=UPI001CA8673D|nr:uncharacterized protein LOC122506932 [Leptopilina heterotoma]